jgi:hypothetical protein
MAQGGKKPTNVAAKGNKEKKEIRESKVQGRYSFLTRILTCEKELTRHQKRDKQKQKCRRLLPN